MNQKTAHLTFDIETDWGGRMLPEFAGCRGIDQGVPLLLEILEEFDARSTFFISGEIAHLYPDLFKEIESRGHELAVHGFSHRTSYETLTEVELQSEVQRGQIAIAEIANRAPIGFRTPQFRVNPLLLEVLQSTGFLYDSSISLSPFSRTRERPHPQSGTVIEYPVKGWSAISIPPGLMWIHRFGKELYLKSIEEKESVLFYAHPFDLTGKRYCNKFSWKVNAWYLTVSVLGVQATLRRVIEGLRDREFVFKTMREACTS